MDSYLKNVIVISFGFTFLFTAYGGLQNLQSSLHSEEGLGVASLSVIYAALILSSMFFPSVVIKKFGCKWTIVGSMCCYITFSLGNFYASWFTLIPTSMILGLGAAPLWSAKCTYLTVAGNLYAQKVGKIGKYIVTQYFGIFFMIYRSSGIWGNLIASLVFDQIPNKVNLTEADMMCCGTGSCMINTTDRTVTSKGPSNTLIYTLMGIYTASEILAVLLVTVFLDQLSTNQAESKEKTVSSFGSTFLETFQHLKDKRQCLLIPLTMYSGLEQGFLAGDYNKSYVTCALGINFVGYVMICFSATNSLASLLFGKIYQFTGRKVLFTLGAILYLGCIIALLLWKPHPNQLALFFIIPAIWGVADAILQTLTNALYGILFEKHKEAAFANYRLWESLGFVIAFGYSTFLSVSIKLLDQMGCAEDREDNCYALRAPVISSKLTHGKSTENPAEPRSPRKGSKSSTTAKRVELGGITRPLVFRLHDSVPSLVLPFTSNCFELFGFDILVDEKMKPWLLEVNHSPGLRLDCASDVTVKRKLLHDIVDLLNYKEADTLRKSRGANRRLSCFSQSQYLLTTQSEIKTDGHSLV
ncbi:protein unc-93A-like [Crotalus adamanteus]|uniref:Protein unc-93 homolog A n=1 Tax=Crotalus adamanteus TaxID=8729 RepID=A0AAW1CD85_CROAD